MQPQTFRPHFYIGQHDTLPSSRHGERDVSASDHADINYITASLLFESIPLIISIGFA